MKKSTIEKKSSEENTCIVLRENPEQLAEAGARLFRKYSEATINMKDQFNVAVSGGSTPRAMHRLLASGQFRSGIEWGKVYIFWVDERCVPYDDPRSNYGSFKADLLDHIDIPSDNVFPIPISGNPETGAEEYQRRVSVFFRIKDDGVPVFDAMFLGIGPDGHTASLFPGQDSLIIRDRTIVSVYGGIPELPRITMTYPVINNSKNIVIMAKGLDKAETVRSVLEDRDFSLPATGVAPIDGRLTWLLDKEAASLLER